MNAPWLQQTFLENRTIDFLLFAGILLTGLLFKKFVSNHFSGLIYRFIKKRTAGADVEQLRALLRKPFGVFIVLISIYIACQQLHWPESWHLATEEKFGLRLVVWKSFQMSIIFSLTWIVTRCTDFFGIVLLERARRTESMADDQLVPFIKESIKFILLVFSFFVALGVVFEVNVASLIAGLGIGGLAIALAAKDTLENLMGSFAIFLDKPFTQGDLVKVGSVQGRVERIGFRSTQLRTLEKTLITVPNKKMMDAELENISLRNMIRAMFPLLIRLETPVEKMELFRDEIRNFLLEHPDVVKNPVPSVKVDRITDAGIELQVLFFVNTLEVEVYAQKKEDILLEILRKARLLDIRFDTKNQDLTFTR